MKKLFASLVMLTFFVPCISFAQTSSTATYSPQYVALLQQLVKLLEQELQISLATQGSVSTTTTATTSMPLATSTGSVVTPVPTPWVQPAACGGGNFGKLDLEGIDCAPPDFSE